MVALRKIQLRLPSQARPVIAKPTWADKQLEVGQWLQDEALRHLQISDDYDSGLRTVQPTWRCSTPERHAAYLSHFHMMLAAEANEASLLVARMTEAEFIEYFDEKAAEARDERLNYLPSN